MMLLHENEETQQDGTLQELCAEHKARLAQIPESVSSLRDRYSRAINRLSEPPSTSDKLSNLDSQLRETIKSVEDRCAHILDQYRTDSAIPNCNDLYEVLASVEQVYGPQYAALGADELFAQRLGELRIPIKSLEHYTQGAPASASQDIPDDPLDPTNTVYTSTPVQEAESNKDTSLLIIEDGKLVGADPNLAGMVILPDDVTVVCDSALSGCPDVTGVTTGKGCVEICDLAFTGCNALTSISLCKGITTLGMLAFFGCRALRNIYYEGTKDEWDKLAAQLHLPPTVSVVTAQ